MTLKPDAQHERDERVMYKNLHDTACLLLSDDSRIGMKKNLSKAESLEEKCKTILTYLYKLNSYANRY